jgi:8-oxo-dGTP pyrophosphatase MutT (NUDIX family)
MTAPAPPTVTPRLAATTLILRDADRGMEVLMVRRSMQASFMPGAYVFPGGAVDAADGDAAHQAACDEPLERLQQRIGAVAGVGAQALAFAVAGLRECFEECGLWLGAPDHHAPAPGWPSLRARLHAGTPLAALVPDAGGPLATSCLQPWSRWVTPVGLPKRFDTLFFVARAPAGQVPTVDEGETTTLAWVQPALALAARERGEFQMEFATVRTVESLQPFATVADLLGFAAGQTSLAAIHPRVVLGDTGKITGVLLPDQPGYDQAWAG